MNAYTETEVKLYVPDLGVVIERLNALGAQVEAPRVFERNQRYDDAEGRLLRQHIVLRLRQDTRARLTYKDELPGADRSRFEAETEVSDYDAMHTILVRLGFQPAFAYEKWRTEYAVETEHGRVLVMLDETPLGNFVEIEGEGPAIDAAQARLGLHTAPVMPGSYGALFANVRRALSLAFTDMTFDHFAGITVPFEALLHGGETGSQATP
jgi:adenylate cyclase class 2